MDQSQFLKIFRPRLYKNRLNGHNDKVIGLNSPNGKDGFTLISVGRDGSVRYWNLAKKQIEHREKVGDDRPIDMCCFYQNIVYLVHGKQLCSWGMLTGQKLCEYRGHSSDIRCLVKINVRVLVSGGADKKLFFWDTCSGEHQLVLDFEDEVDALQLITQNDTLAILTGRRTIWIWDVEHGKMLLQLQFTTFLTSFLMDRDDLLLTTVEQKLQLYSLKALQSGKIQALKTAEDLVGWGKRITIVGQWLILNTDSKSLFVFGYPSLKLFQRLEGCPNQVTCFEIADNTVFAGCLQSSIRTWDIKELDCRKRDRQMMLREDLLAMQHRKYLQKMVKNKKKKKK